MYFLAAVDNKDKSIIKIGNKSHTTPEEFTSEDIDNLTNTIDNEDLNGTEIKYVVYKYEAVGEVRQSPTFVKYTGKKGKV